MSQKLEVLSRKTFTCASILVFFNIYTHISNYYIFLSFYDFKSFEIFRILFNFS